MKKTEGNRKTRSRRLPAGGRGGGELSDQANQLFKPLTPERAVELTERILDRDDDEQVLAFVELIQGIAYELDLGRRDYIATPTINHAFTHTGEFSDATIHFLQKAIAPDRAVSADY